MKVVALLFVTICIYVVEGFIQQTPHVCSTSLYFFGKSKKNDETKVDDAADTDTYAKMGIFGDLKGMFENLDEVVDDFFYKKMGAGEQWYGKRKYNPSGRIEGDYNGMGQSDSLRIEIARVQKEEIEGDYNGMGQSDSLRIEIA